MVDNMKIIEDQRFGEERALYNLTDATVRNCSFKGEEDGESALKECRGVTVEDCAFSLRYPLWHAKNYTVKDSDMDEKVRAPIWYAENGVIDGCSINGVKCLRECDNTILRSCKIVSEEFGWLCRGVNMSDCTVESQYLFFKSSNVSLNNVAMKGKYSFQYIDGLTIENSFLDTKDAFWHSRNVTVKNCTVKGEYLGWFSEGLTLINCKIIGTQPLCYCKELKLIDCEMEDTDLSFEYSDVEADIIGDIISVKNPRSGYISADGIGEIIYDGSIMESRCEIKIKCK